MAASDLVPLASVKAWLGISTGASDVILAALITSVSRAIYGAMQRPNIFPVPCSESLNGLGADRITLKSWPVISFVSLYIDGTLIAPAPPLPQAPVANYGFGWVLESVNSSPPGRPASLYLRGGRFWKGVQNVVASYTAGYQVAETQTIAAAALTALAPFGAWATDQGVTYAADGASLAEVASAPTVGQYTVTAAGAYGFNAADNGAAVILSYGYVPADLAQAAMEWVGQRFKAGQNIGFRSKSIGGQETIAIDTSAMPSSVAAMIQPYKRVALC